MKIALDAMGTDERPVHDVAGAVQAAREYNCDVVLVGDKARVEAELAKHKTNGLTIRVVHAAQEITMDDSPTESGRAKPESSMHVGMNLVKSGEADAFVTAGNTGAALAIATVYTLRRIRGVRRPALTTIYPFGEKMVTILDVGANSDCKPEWLSQFAIMGSLYAGYILGIAQPGVALITVPDPNVRNPLIDQTHAILEQLPLNYVGRIPPSSVPDPGIHVVVTDGFLGNILMKTYEASLRYTSALLREKLRSNLRLMIGGLLMRPGINRLRKRIDPSTVGGAPLLGIDGVVIVAHGSSNATAIKNAVGQAIRAVENNIVGLIRTGMKDLEAVDLNAL